jgi:phospholipase C
MIRHSLLGMALLLAGCTAGSNPSSPVAPRTANIAADAALRADIHTVVIIYAENRSFDNLFGSFPGANGIPAQGRVLQQDRDEAATVLPKLPQTWGGVTAPGQNVTVTQAQSDNLPNAPYSLEQTYPGLTANTVTRDLWHLFFVDQMQIDGGKNDRFAAWGDSGGLTMGHFDNSGSRLWQIARQGVLADNYFQGAFGGSFLNHQLKLMPACPAGAAQAPRAGCSPASALDGPPRFVVGNDALAPRDYFGAGDGFRAVNTMAPPYQPSWIPPARDDARHLYADPHSRSVLMPQTIPTIGDLLSSKHVSWAWYSGAWRQAVAATTAASYGQPPQPGGQLPPPVAPTFQYHHQPFNYYQAFDPGTDSGSAARAAHLKDYQDLLDDIASARLPQVVFYKPEGDLNQHPGYSDVANFDTHVAELLARLQASPQYEFGGQWDHVAPPKGEPWTGCASATMHCARTVNCPWEI